MKPVHIGLLVAAGALGGALLVKMMQQPSPAPEPAPVVAQEQQAPAAPEPVAAEPAPAEPRPTPFPEKQRREARRGAPVERAAAPAPVQQAVPPAPAPAPAPAEPAPPAAPLRAREPEPPAPPPPPRRVTIPAGTLLPVRLVEGLSTERNQPGDTFSATLDQPLTVDGFVIAERGARLEGRIVEAQESGRVRGVASMGIALTRLRTSDGQNIAIATETFTQTAPKSVGEDVKRGAAATGIGAAIGAIAGGGKGAAIGAAIGAAAGTGGALATKGKPAVLPTETRINFRLSEPVSITERR